MSFLLGAFGKFSAGRRKREIQYQKMKIESQKRLITKQIADMDKQLQRAEQADKNNINAHVALAKQGQTQEWLDRNELTDLSKADQSKLAEYNQFMQNIDAWSASLKSAYETQIANHYEYLREVNLEPLKQEEDKLQTEIDSLQTQLEMADADYKACQEMEKDGAKEMAPKYTGGGN